LTAIRGEPETFEGVPQAGQTRTNGLSVLKATLGHYRGMKRTVIWLTERQRRALTVLSRKSLAPVSALVRHAVDEYLRKRQKHRRTAAARR
jgi:hypothetical protein